MKGRFQNTHLASGFRTGALFGALLLAVCAVHVLTVRAQVASSTDFVLRDGVMGMYGGFVSSTDYQTVSNGAFVQGGFSSSTDFGSQNGPLGPDSFTPASAHWRWYSDTDHETPVVPLASENVAPADVEARAPLKLRLTIKETGGVGANGVKYRLQYSETSDFSSGVFDVAEATACASTTVWCYSTSSTGADNEIVNAAVLSDADACSGGVGTGCGTHNLSGISTSTFTENASSATEFEFTLVNAWVVPNTTYFFRAYDNLNNTPVPLNGTNTYPSLSTVGASLSFSIDGLPDSTTTGGITTDVSSTATAVSFGQLILNNQRTAAQRLTISTDANAGYTVYATEDQDLTNDLSEHIPPIDATNGGPAAWNAACVSTSTGCYGYHTTANVLSGGSTRFAADDTYAKFETALREVAYSALPATNESTDIIYKIQVQNDQPNGAYQHAVNYIIVPTF